MGDSIGAQALTGTANQIGYENIGYATALRNVFRGRLWIPPENFFAVSGTNSTEWISSGQHTAAAASKARFVCMVLPTNDVGQSVPLATTKSNLQTIFSTLRAAGKIIVAHPILPRWVDDSYVNWANGQTISIGDFRKNGSVYYRALSAGTTATGSAPTHTSGDVAGADTIIWRYFSVISQAQAQNLHAINNWFRQYVLDNPELGILVPDATAKIIDPTSSLGNPLLEMFRDGLHPQNKGAFIIADAFRTAMDSLVPAYDPRFRSAYDVYNASTNPQGNLIVNGLLAGTGGTEGTSASGDTADSWELNRVNSGGIGTLTAVASKVSRSDGEQGVLQRITISGTPTGDAGFRFRQALNASNYSVGDILEMLSEISWAAGATGIRGVNIRLTATNGSTNPTSVDADVFAGSFFLTDEARSNLVYRTARLTLPSGTTAVEARMEIFCRANVACSLVVDISRVSVKKVLP
jgi:lysophospholipase L1-like esterase